MDELKRRFNSIKSMDSTALFVADLSNEVVGWIYVGLVFPLTSPARAQIWGLVIDESIRRKGIGKNLVSEAEKWALDNLGVNSIGVGSNLKRIESHAFYKSIGYTEKKKWAVYQKALT